MEKIYSRRRIRLPKISKFKIYVMILLIIISTVIIMFICAAYPIFEASCKNKASSIGINVATNEVNKVMTDYQYEDLVSIEKNSAGDITVIEAKIVVINEMISKITANIKNEIDRSPQVEVEINLGAVSGFSFLSKYGPKFNIKMEASGGVNASLESEFTSVRNKPNFT